MNESPLSADEFWALVDESFNTLLADEDLRRVEDHLAANPPLQRDYLRMCRMHADLRLIAGARRAVERTRATLESLPIPSAATPAPESLPPLPGASLWSVLTDSSTWANRFVWVGALAIAVSFYGIFGLLVWSMSKPPLRDEVRDVAGNEHAERTSGEHSIAQVARSVGAVWREGHGPRDAEGNAARQLSYQLDRGVAEIVLAQGARVTLTGPAEFDVRSGNSGYLHRGKLLALAPPRAVGFTVETDRATIVDRGTEFGVEVDEQGTAEVHVLQGKVDVAASGAAGSAIAPVRVGRNEAVRIGPDRTVTPVAFNRNNYSSQLPPLAARDHLPEQLPGLRLWLRADRGVELDAAGNVVRWADQSERGFDALQREPAHRPHWSQTAGAAPAIHFDGVDDFLECTHGLGLDGPADGTYLFVLLANQCRSKNLGIFSIRSRDLADWNSPDGFALASSQLNNDRLAAASGAVAAAQPGSDSLQMDALLPDTAPYVLTVTKKSGTGTFRVNGTTQAVDSFSFHAEPDQSSRSAAGYFVGARCDNGGGRAGCSLFGAFEIAEIMLFDRALVGVEATTLEAELMRRAREKTGAR